MRRVETSSTAGKTADVLREVILEGEGPGRFLGSEDELISKLGVSRPTLRQATRILEAEGLLEVRRGWNGGFFTREPELTGVVHMTNIYLRSKHTTYGEVWNVRTLLGAEVCALAAENPDAPARRELLDEVLAAKPATSEDISRLARLSPRFLLDVTTLVPSVTLNLLVRSLVESTRTSYATRWFMEPEEQTFTYDHLHKIAWSIARGYGDAARNHYLTFGRDALERFPRLMADRIEPRFQMA